MADRKSAAGEGGAGARVLVLEADEMVRRMMARQLAQLGHTAVETGDPGEARRRGAAGEPAIDLLITGVALMRNVDGAALAVEMRRAHPRTAVLVVSGYVDARLEAALAKEGVQVLAKPFRFREFARKVRLALAARGP